MLVRLRAEGGDAGVALLAADLGVDLLPGGAAVRHRLVHAGEEVGGRRSEERPDAVVVGADPEDLAVGGGHGRFLSNFSRVEAGCWRK